MAAKASISQGITRFGKIDVVVNNAGIGMFGVHEVVACEPGMFGIRVKIVEPGLAPSTSFAANSGARCDNTIPAAYADYAGRYLKSMQEYSAACTTVEDVAETVYAAATDDLDKLRYPAGADSVMLSNLRQSLPEQEFMTRIRTMSGGKLVRDTGFEPVTPTVSR